jgi:Zn-dependent metalloprotease
MRTRLLAACLTLSLTACDGGAPEPRQEAEVQATEPASTQDLQSALAALPGAEVVGTHEDGVPFMIRGPLGTVERSLRAATAQEAHAQASAALAKVAPVFRLRTSDLVAKRLTQDEQGHTHLRYAQMRNGLPVVGHELILHIDDQGRVYAANGSARDGESVPAPSQARVSPEAATAAALKSTLGVLSTEGAPSLVYVRSEADQRLKLAFEVLVTGESPMGPVRDHVFIHALDGSEVARFSDIHEARNRYVYSARNGTSVPGTLVRTEGSAPTGDVVVDKTYDNLGIFYDCFYGLFGRDSFNNAGAALRASVHYSTNYASAFWNGSYLVCGDGDGVNMSSPCTDSDVVVHEYTHAVTDYESGLVYSGESGGLSESYSDIFASVCESRTRGFVLPDVDAFKIAEDIWTPSTPGDALRYLYNPKLDGVSLDYYADYNSSVNVHYSSGIPNLAYSLLAQGGTHPRGRSTISVSGIGVERAGRVFYRANTDYMTATTTFAQAKTYTEQVASVLGYPVASVTAAWQAVGVGLTTPPPPVTSTPLTNGVATTGLAGASGSQVYFHLDVPANKPVTFTISGGTGDADMYVKFGSAPTTASYDCRPYLTGNSETCSIAAKTTSGRYYVMLRGYSAYSGVSLLGQYTP